MTTRTLAALMLATLLAGACGSDPGDPEVLGVVVERSDEVPSAPEPVETSEYQTSAPAREAPAVSGRGLATLAATEETADAEGPAPQPVQPATTAPSSPEPEPTPEPSVAPAQLAEGPGSTYTWSQPEDPPEDGTWWWIEASSLPGQNRDADPWNGTRVAARDVDAVQGEDMTTHRVRRATCEAWLDAPTDRAVQGSGTVTVELLVNDALAASGAYPFDGTLEPGARWSFDPVGDATVDAREGDTVTCTVRFDAD